MPVLSNPRHERFAQELAKGKSATEAYVIAGFKANSGNAATLKAQQSISKRADEIRAERFKIAEKATEKAAERLSVTVESLIVEAEEARQLAMQIGQPSAAIAAVKEKGILSGTRIEKSERKTFTDARHLTDDELDAAIADAIAREQAEAGGSGLTH